MPARNQILIRRDINRLNEIIESKSGDKLALGAIQAKVKEATDNVNNAWQAYQSVAITGD